MHTGEGIRLVRKFADLTQEEMAERLDITSTHLSLIENGKSNPSLGLLEKIERVFGVPTSFLVWDSHFQSRVTDSDVSERYRRLGEQMLELAATLVRRSAGKRKR